MVHDESSKKLRIIHLDDDFIFCDRIKGLLSSSSIQGKAVHLTSVQSVAAFKIEIEKSDPFDAALIDIHITPAGGEIQATGIDLAAELRQRSPHTVIIMMSSTRDAKLIGRALKAGADDFADKSLGTDDLLLRLESTLEFRKGDFISETSDDQTPSGLVAGVTMSAIQKRIPSLIKSAVNCIYIEGESGTGKEVVANLFAAELARHAPSRSIPFVRINCGAIAPSLIASELFGHVKGAFTGAQSDKVGLLESADGGWVFMDEVATLSQEAQVSLLRAIENQAIRRLGSSSEKKIQFRILSATNEPLSQLVDQGKFRKDLWQRLCETEIKLPPLRERRDEIPALIDFFLREMRGGPYSLAPTVREILVSSQWLNGNARELRNVLRAMTERAVNKVLTPKSIPERIWKEILPVEGDLSSKDYHTYSSRHDSHVDPKNHIVLHWQGTRPSYDELIQLLLRDLIRTELSHLKSSGAYSLRALSKSLGIPKSTLASRIKELIDLALLKPEEIDL